MGREIELRRHTDADGDVLTPESVTAALEIGAMDPVVAAAQSQPKVVDGKNPEIVPHRPLF